tara:strand:+ start:5751 stop:5852 length:102 start_codon:yes stop_codon:yes gene_type:complete
MGMNNDAPIEEELWDCMLAALEIYFREQQGEQK